MKFFVAEQLKKVRAHKAKLLQKLKSASEYEQLLIEKLQQRREELKDLTILP